jgi:hypothetical protein
MRSDFKLKADVTGTHVTTHAPLEAQTAPAAMQHGVKRTHTEMQTAQIPVRAAPLQPVVATKTEDSGRTGGGTEAAEAMMGLFMLQR